jgi:hypothetical protein
LHQKKYISHLESKVDSLVKENQKLKEKLIAALTNTHNSNAHNANQNAYNDHNNLNLTTNPHNNTINNYNEGENQQFIDMKQIKKIEPKIKSGSRNSNNNKNLVKIDNLNLKTAEIMKNSPHNIQNMPNSNNYYNMYNNINVNKSLLAVNINSSNKKIDDILNYEKTLLLNNQTMHNNMNNLNSVNVIMT